MLLIYDISIDINHAGHIRSFVGDFFPSPSPDGQIKPLLRNHEA